MSASASSVSLSSFNPKSLPLCVSRSASILPPSLSFKLHSIFASSAAVRCSSSPAQHPSRFARNVAVSSDFEVEEEDMFTDGDDDSSPPPPRGGSSFSADLKLFVGNLSFDVDSAQLAQLFESAGTVEMVEVIYDKVTGRSRGFGFVTMSTAAEVEAAAQQFNGYELEGRALREHNTKKNREEREIQKNYWKEHSVGLSVEAMMLDSKAADLDKEERPEILSLLPPIEGETVLEFGAGIGRFTSELAQKAGQVIAVDFIESVIKKNKNINGHYKNVKFMCADVTSPDMKFSDESVDLIFSNWLLMYLSDKEVEDLAKKMLQWTKVGGYIFFRESCFHQSGDNKRKYNPTHYREPKFYTKLFKECHMNDDLGNSYEFSLVSCKCVGAYVRNKKNQNQICWLWQKKVSSDNDRGFQRFLDNVQYKSSGILRYERVFGQGFVSTGGLETTKEFVAKLDLKPGQKVLDVGCGIGGGDFYMAENFDVDVVGIDLSVNMISFALEHAIGLKCSVEFEVADCTKKEYPDNTFDVIYSRDTILHIQDKPALFRTFYKWLKPGGKVLITDYCRSPKTPSQDFANYIKQRGYDLHAVQTYGQMLKDAGFDEVIAEDRTDQFMKVLKRELDAVEKEKDEFISDFSKEDYEDIVGGWNSKLLRSSSGEQKWGLFIAKKN